MDFNEYQNKAKQFAIYKDKIVYPTLGLASEAGEVCGKIKKIMRDTDGIHNLKYKYDRVLEIKSELGDVLWYIANIAEDLNIPLQDIAEENIGKLQDRKDRDKIQGSGDNR
jgi:NTP pyrophosphatase (non-canonical NTP hydrolase)